MKQFLNSSSLNTSTRMQTGHRLIFRKLFIALFPHPFTHCNPPCTDSKFKGVSCPATETEYIQAPAPFAGVWVTHWLESFNRLGVRRVSQRLREHLWSLWSWLLIELLPVFTFLHLQGCPVLQALLAWVLPAHSLWLITEQHIYNMLSCAKAAVVTT